MGCYKTYHMIDLLGLYVHMFNRHHLHVLGHVWSLLSSWRTCWSLHLNCGQPMFRHFGGFILKFISLLLILHKTHITSLNTIFMSLAQSVHSKESTLNKRCRESQNVHFVLFLFSWKTLTILLLLLSHLYVVFPVYTTYHTACT